MPRTSVVVGVQIGSATVTTAFSKEGFRSAIQGLRRDLDRDLAPKGN